MLVKGAGNAMAAAVVDELTRHGVVTAVFGPGSRSTPLVLALDAHPQVKLHVAVDERSAGFVAVGAARASGMPAIVLTTSGTAAANLHPAILEAHHSRLPLIAITADRPPELRDTGAGQTIDQIKMFGDSVRWFCEAGVADGNMDLVGYSRSIASRAFAEAVGSPRGPVHLNLAFREPFIAEPHDEEVDIAGRPEGMPWTQIDAGQHELSGMEELATRIEAAERGLLVVGAGEIDPMAVERFARATGWPVIAEAHSGCRTGKHVISLYDAIIRCTPFAETHTPDLVIRLGSIGTSRRLTEFLGRGPDQISIDRDGRWLDPSRALTRIVRADPGAALDDLSKRMGSSGSSSWLIDWQEAESAAEGAADSAMAELGLCEPVAARVATQSIPSGSTLLVASSMPVRDVDWFMLPRSDLEVQSNRGTNGIDGFISTAAGFALSGKQTFGLCGDLAFLHDVGGLLTARMNEVAATIVVLNNDGGGIFGFLPQRELGETFTRLFATPHGSDIGAVAESFGCAYTLCQSPNDLRVFIAKPPANGVHILEVRTALDSNVSAHERIWAAVDEAVRK